MRPAEEGVAEVTARTTRCRRSDACHVNQGFLYGLPAIPLDKPRGTDDTAPASPDLLRPVATALADIPAPALTEAEATDFKHGQATSLAAPKVRIPGSADPAGVWRVPWRGAA